MWLEEISRLLEATTVQRRPLSDGLMAAAVLVPLYVAAGGLWVLLTRRSEALAHHAGQTSFPGGAREERDADEVTTALREAHEELGACPSKRVGRVTSAAGPDARRRDEGDAPPSARSGNAADGPAPP